MRLVILICAVFAITLAKKDTQEEVVVKPDSLPNVLKIKHKCEIETNPPPEAFKNMLKATYENEAALHFSYCYLTHTGYVSEDGHFVVSKLISVIKEQYPKEEELIKTMIECNKLNGKDPVDTLRVFIDCFRENSPIVFTL
ncbi:uncharacterized protein [Epargyreus clarus]|uniref:uncharacterized protein n=1 Tax=Epargyreus clarus TaxID=520877 RepID=UPI003C2F9AC7